MEEVLRSDLIESLEAHVAPAAGSKGITVLLEAPAGGGKSVLVDQWRRASNAGKFSIARCDHLETPIPFAPLMTLADELDPALEHALVAGDRPEALRRLVRAVDRPPGPKVIVIEDAHLIDQPSAELLVALAGRTERLPVVLTFTHRSERSDHGPPFSDLLLALPAGSTTTVEIPPLTTEEIGRLVPAGTDPSAVLRDTGGLPLLVTEAAASGDVGRDLRRLVLSRFDRLSPDGQAALALAACAPEGLETTILDATHPNWHQELEPAESSHLIVLSGAQVRFRHELFRSIVHDDMTAIRRRFVHAEILKHLPEHTGAGRRSVHATAAGDVDAVIENAPRAAREAQRLGAHRAAVAHLERALEYAYSIEPHTRLGLFGSLARSAWAIGDVETARRAITTAMELAIELGERRGNDLVHAARIEWYTGDGARAESLLDEAIADLRKSSETAPGLASALGYRSLLAGIRISRAAAQPFIDDAMATLSELENEPAVSAQVLNDVGTVEFMYDAGAGSSLASAKEIAERHDLRLELVRTEVNRAFGAMMRHDHREAQPAIRRATSLADELQVRAFEDIVSLIESQLAFDQGRWDDATDLLATIERAGPKAGFSGTTGKLLGARIAIRRGATDAPERAREALRLGLDDGEPERISLAVSLAAEERWLKAGEPPIGAFDAARSSAETSGHPWWIEELAFWESRFAPVELPSPARTPFGVALSDPAAAARDFEALGMIYERLLIEVLSDNAPAMLSALETLDEMGARALATIARRRLEELGVSRIPRGPNRTTRDNPAGLTPRQMDVLWLVRDGLTNAEIAERLYLSTRTVDHHVAAVLRKLEINSRREVADRAAELGLVRS